MLRRICAVFIVLLLVSFSPAAAHQQLLRSAPAEGASLAAPPESIRLTFNQRIELALARLTLTGPAGEVALGPLEVPADSATILTASIAGEMVPGEYLVDWLVTGDDGHPVRGTVRFVVRESADRVSPVPGMVDAAPPTPRTPSQGITELGERSGPPVREGFTTASPLYVAARWINFVGIVAAIGAAAFGLFLVPQLVRRGIARSPALDEALRRAAGVGAVATGTLAIALILRLAAQTAAMGAGGWTESGRIAAVVLGRTVWGLGWMLQAVALLVLFFGFAAARRSRRKGWVLAAGGALLLSVSPALSGHAVATSAVAVAADALHVLGAGGWLGTLLVLVIAAPPLVRGSDRDGAASAATLLAAFTPLALSFAALLTLTGTYAAWLHLPAVAALWTTPYGRILLLKLGALALVFALGAYNWRRVRPRIGTRGDLQPLRGSATAELVGAALVLAITAALVATPPPGESGATPDRPAEASASPHLGSSR